MSAELGRRLARSWPAVLAWCLATVVVCATAAAHGFDPLHPVTWARFDSFLYLGIADHGYTLIHCSPPDARLWCGNAGWFPGYPAVVALLHLLGLPLMRAAVAISWCLAFATLLLLRGTFLRGRLSVMSGGALLYAAFAPGRVYHYAVFPLSLLAFCTVAHLWLLHRGRRVAAGIMGACAALAYPSGLALAATSALWLALPHDGLALRVRLRAAGVVSGLILVGGAVTVLVQWLEVGRWNAYFLVQSHYNHALRQPFAPAIGAVRVLSHSSPLRVENAPEVQTLLLAAVLLCVVAELLLHRRSATRLDLLVLLWAVGTWVLTESQSNLSGYRGEASLLPLALLVRRLPTPLLFAIVAVAIWLTVPMTELFVRSLLE
jgi:hypothetical protein